MQGIPQGTQPGQQGNNSKPSLSWQTPQTTPKPVTPPPVQNNNAAKPPTPPPTKTSERAGAVSNSNTGTYVLIFVAGLIVGILIGWGVLGARNNSSTTASTTDESMGSTTTSGIDMTGTTMGAASTGEIVVDSPQSAGSNVVVSKASVNKPTWVVIYDNVNGAPGHALGAVLFFPATMKGKTSDTIELLRPTVAGTSYLVGELLDDGDPNLSFATDKPIVDSSGKQMLTTLTVK